MRHINHAARRRATTLLLAFPASAADSPPFPRLAGVNNGGPHNYEDPAYQAKLAKLNFSILEIWVGWEATSRHDHGAGGAQHQSDQPRLQGVPVREPHGSGRRQCGRGSRVQQGRSDEVVGLPRGARRVAALAFRQASIESPISGQHDVVHAAATAPAISSGNGTPAGSCSSSTSRIRRSTASSRTTFSGGRASTRTGIATASPIRGFAAGRQVAARSLSPSASQLLHTLMPGKLMIGNIADWGRSSAVITELDQTLNGGLSKASSVRIIPRVWAHGPR